MKRAVLALVLLLVGCGVQPTDPISGSPATGALLYLVRNNTVVPILRPTQHPTSQTAALTLLAEGPSATEKGLGYTSEVPRIASPATIKTATVELPIDVSTLSPTAATQIVCTSAIPGDVTLVGGGQRLAPKSCPVTL